MTDKAIRYFRWTKQAGKYWPIGPHGLSVIAMTKWSCWALGIEVFQYGACLFFGPLCIGIGTVVDDQEVTP